MKLPERAALPVGGIKKNLILHERANEKRYGLPFVTLVTTHK